jgi:dephospho-CoA kinase
MTPLVVGIIGAIGAGKSTVARLFAQQGGTLIVGDEIGHAVLCEPAVRDAVLAQWGAGVRDARGEIDRKKLGSIVFANARDRLHLESLLFPRIGQHIREHIAQAPGPFVVLDAAVMLEAGWAPVCDLIVFVDAARDARVRRLREQRGWDTDELARREAAQLPLNQKKARAHRVIDNTGDPGQLQAQVDAIVQELREKKLSES